MTTVRDICTDALIELGALAIGEVMTAEDGQFALRTLNRMMQKWNTEELMVYTVNRDLYALTAGQASYTFGVGGNWNAERPVRIDRVSVLLNYSPRPIEVPLRILTDEDWQETAVKTTPSSFPTEVWITGNYPLNTLVFFPVPQDSTNQIVIYSWGKTSAFADLDTAVDFPNGYEEAIVTNLAVYLSSSYGRELSPVLGQRASLSKAAIESQNNVDPLFASFDGFGAGAGRAVAIATNGYQVDR